MKLISKNIYKIRKKGELKKNRDLKNQETGGYLNMPNNKRNLNLHFQILTFLIMIKIKKIKKIMAIIQLEKMMKNVKNNFWIQNYIQ